MISYRSLPYIATAMYDIHIYQTIATTYIRTYMANNHSLFIYIATYICIAIATWLASYSYYVASYSFVAMYVLEYIASYAIYVRTYSNSY